jgi:hypothetical protein
MCTCDAQARDSVVLGEPFYDLRETLKFVFVNAARGETVLQVG